MDIINWFRKPKQTEEVVLRCTHCKYELDYTVKELKKMEKHAQPNSPCPFMDPCHICHTGFMIPISYQSDDGKLFLFKKIKSLLKNLDPDSAWIRIYENNH